MNTTTKRYPRTTTEAFSDADRAGCVQGPYLSSSTMAAKAAKLAALIVGFVLLAFVGVSA